MSSDPTGAAAPGIHTGDTHDHDNASHDDPTSIAVVNPKPETNPSKPTGLHSPPDSNNVDDDSTDSELSDFDEAIADADGMDLDSLTIPTTKATATDPAQAPATADAGTGPDHPEQVPTPEQDEDIGEVLPDHWSGTVPVFKPTMQQFKSFKKFVCRLDDLNCASFRILTQGLHRWKQSTPTA